jgi:hypothetical protein
MKYESPELTALTPAIDAIQAIGTKLSQENLENVINKNEPTSAYQDWE